MEQHPVPQNVTTFQFRLIGDMTIKQFGYLAGGAILAYISYKLPLPFFFTWPMTAVFALGGVGFAFVPVEDRPMDVWVLSFLKNVYSPTQFVWAHEEPPAPPPVAKQPARPVAGPAAQAAVAPPRAVHPSGNRSVSHVLEGLFGSKHHAHTTPAAPPLHAQTSVPAAPTPPPARIVTAQNKTEGAFDWLTSLFSFRPSGTAPASRMPSSAPNIPTPSITGSRFDISLPPVISEQKTKEQQRAIEQTLEKEELLETKVSELKKELETKTMNEARIVELQTQLMEVMKEHDRMQGELIALKKQPISRQSSPPVAPAAPPASARTAAVATPAPPRQPTVTIITPEGAIKAGLPRLTTFPNVVTGIIKDNENNLLPGVLVTVKDKDGMPLRALKTNRLGQFAASTPLSNGTYLVEIEDPRSRYIFDRVQITLNGSIVPAIEVVAKSQKELSRAKLAAELFGSTQT